MKLISCYIENFGKLHQFQYVFDDGLNVILEENGWGKTTFAMFMKSMFYGMNGNGRKSVAENERKHYLPWQGGKCGGNIVFEANGKKYRVERTFGEREKDDTFVIYDCITGTVSTDYDSHLGEELFGLDVTGYERSTFFAKDDKELAINDSLSAKLNNTANGIGESENYEPAMDRLDECIKFYKRTGNRGRIAELEAQIAELTRDIEQLENRTDTVDSLKAKKAQLDEQRNAMMEESKRIRAELKAANEYEAYKAKKAHYDTLTKARVMAKSSVESAAIFFDRPELMKDIERKLDEYDSLEELELKCRDEEENLKELEYRKHALKEQYLEQKKTPMASVLMMLFGIVFAGCGVCLWALMSMPIYVLLGGCAVGIILALIGIISWTVGSNRIKREYDAQIDDVDELITCSNAAIKDFNLQKEMIKKGLENYVRAFQVDTKAGLVKALAEIDAKIKEYKQLLEANEKAMVALNEFEQNNEMDKIRGLTVPKHTAEELHQKESEMESVLMGLMEERNNVSRRMDALVNADEDENDLRQEKERLQLELKEITERYEILELTKQYLQSANESFKVKYIQSMKDAFKEYVTIFNGICMENVSVDLDLKLSIDEFGELHGSENLSSGYRDMLDICTKLALVKAMFTAEQPFIIMDDPFVNLDQDKIGNAMKFLTELGEKQQLIYFTCHESRATLG